MAFGDFRALQQAVFRLYNEKRYEDGLRILEAEMSRFQEQSHNTCFWRACLLARLARLDDSLAALQIGLDQGLWFPMTMLREDSDLAPIQHLPGFEALRARNAARQAEAQAQAVPQRLTLLPEGAAPPYSLLVALHGNNSNSRNTADYWRPALAQGWLLALPQSSQVNGPDAFCWNDRDWAMREVKQHYAELTGEHPVDPGRTVVGGFSMGGGTAIWLALSQAIPVRGFVAVGPWLEEVSLLRPFLETAPPVRGAILVGEQDAQCLKVSRELADLMQEYGLACRLEVIPGLAHAYPEGLDRMLPEALGYILGE